MGMLLLVMLLVQLACINESAGLSTTNYHYDKGVVDKLSPCPGYYCGRTLLNNGSWSACGACERGTRRNSSSACSPCTDNPGAYDWLYLGFMMLAPLVLNLLSLDLAIKKHKLERRTWLLYLCVLLEVVASALITLLLTPPLGSLRVQSCRPRHLRDWYPLLHNPNPNYEGYLHCTQEAVYPMYSMVLVGYSVLLVLVLALRPELTRFVSRGAAVTGDAGAVYAALYLLPALTVMHALLAGLLYEIFPYVVIIGSIISCATYFAFQRDQSMVALVRGCVRDARSLIIVLSHWALHAYGLVSLTYLGPTMHYALCSLVPLPALFYILTARFSDPSVIPVEGNTAPPQLCSMPE